MKREALSIFNFSIINQAEDTLDIYIDGDIVDAETQEILRNYWGDETSVSYRSFRDQVNQANPKTINVYVNSYGGHVGDAMAIHDFLASLEEKGITVNREGRGIIASAATYIVMGRNSRMSENSWMMVHNASGVIWGDVETIENYAKTIRKFNNAIRDFYARHTGLKPEQVTNLMNKETWMTAAEAKEKGFISEITGSATFSNSIKPEQWQFSNKAVLNSYNSFCKPKNTSDMDTTKITDAINNGFTALLEKLGIKNKSEEQPVKDALTEFSKNITDELAKIEVPTNESIQKLVDDAVKNTFKELPESFKSAITDSTKDALKKDDLKPITDSLEEMKEAMANFSGPKTKNESKEGDGKDKPAKINANNIFKGQKLFTQEN